MRAPKAFSIAILLLASWPGHARMAAPKVSKSCASPEHRQFDFWVGDWDAFDVDAPGKPVARNHVDVILDGCALREVYEQTNGLEKGGVRETAEASGDGGKTWKPVFDIVFRPHKG